MSDEKGKESKQTNRPNPLKFLDRKNENEKKKKKIVELDVELKNKILGSLSFTDIDKLKDYRMIDQNDVKNAKLISLRERKIISTVEITRLAKELEVSTDVIQSYLIGVKTLVLNSKIKLRPQYFKNLVSLKGWVRETLYDKDVYFSSPFPNIKELSVDGVKENLKYMSYLMSETWKIEKLKIDRTSNDNLLNLHKKSLVNLKSLQISCNIFEPQIANLIGENCEELVDLFIIADNTDEKSFKEFGKKLYPKKLESFTFTGALNDMGIFYLNSNTDEKRSLWPNLNKITLKRSLITDDGIGELVNSNLFPFLQTLHIEDEKCLYGNQSMLKLTENPDRWSNLKQLRLNISNMDRKGFVNIVENYESIFPDLSLLILDGQNSPGEMVEIISMISYAFPNLKEIEIHSDIDLYVLLHISKWLNLETLTLLGNVSNIQRVDYHEDLIMKNLKSLSVNINYEDLTKIIFPYRIPNLKKLTIDECDVNNIDNIINLFSNIKNLTVKTLSNYDDIDLDDFCEDLNRKKGVSLNYKFNKRF